MATPKQLRSQRARMVYEEDALTLKTMADGKICFVYYISLANVILHIEIIKMPVRYILSSVWVRLCIFFTLSIIQYVGLYVFSLPISLVMIERIYKVCLLIIIKSEVWTITHCLELDHETMVSAVCLSIFLSTWYCDKSDILLLYTLEPFQSENDLSIGKWFD